MRSNNGHIVDKSLADCLRSKKSILDPFSSFFARVQQRLSCQQVSLSMTKKSAMKYYMMLEPSPTSEHSPVPIVFTCNIPSRITLLCDNRI